MRWGKGIKTAVMVILVSAVVFVSASCGSSKDDFASKAVESYLQALVSEDVDRLATLSCHEWEERAVMEVDAFVGVSASLNNLKCEQTDLDNDSALVSCQGEILATYNNEQQSLPLDGLVYRVILENGEWLVCGYE